MIKIKTYYQKHRQIKAFQFDGTIQQLKDELPDIIFNELIAHFQYDPETYLTVELNAQNQIKNLVALNQYWPRKNYKLRNPKQHWNDIYKMTPQQVFKIRSNIKKTYKYDHLLKILHQNDYVSIGYHLRKDIYQFIQNHNQNRKDVVNQIYQLHLAFHRKNDFEAHWSKKPIKSIHRK